MRPQASVQGDLFGAGAAAPELVAGAGAPADAADGRPPSPPPAILSPAPSDARQTAPTNPRMFARPVRPMNGVAPASPREPDAAAPAAPPVAPARDGPQASGPPEAAPAEKPRRSGLGGLVGLRVQAQSAPEGEAPPDQAGDDQRPEDLAEQSPPPPSQPTRAPTGLAALRSAQGARSDDGGPEPGAPGAPPKDKDDGSVEIMGRVSRVIFKADDGFKVLLVSVGKDDISLRTRYPIDSPVNQMITARGEWGSYKGKPSFEAKSVIIAMPKDPQGIVGWLKLRSVPNVGEKTGQRIVEHFGLDAIEAMRDPDKLVEAGIPLGKAKAISDAWINNSAQPELVTYLLSLGMGEMTVTKVMQRFGMMARRIIEDNPWKLAETIDGIGFFTADEVARKAKHERTSPVRIKAGIRYALREAINNDGHCGLPLPELTAASCKLLGLDRRQIEPILAEVLESDSIAFDEGTGLAAPRVYMQRETELATFLDRLLKTSGFRETDAADAVAAAESALGISLDESQRRAAVMALSSGVSIITGGPGTGKSTTQKVIVAALKEMGRNPVAAAPTGRAAKRLSETSGLDASTCHRLLQFSPEKGGFNFDKDNPFDEDWFIVDEFSMIDVNLALSFVQAVPLGAGLTIVGDVDQLPSVGPGQVLRDLIESGAIPTARLTTIHRQGKDSGIVVAAHRINSGAHPRPDPKEDLKGFHILPVDDAEATIRRVVKLMTTTLPERGFDPLADVQVLTAMRKGDVGVNSLNDAIKLALNPATDDGRSVTIRNKTFTVGDRVMHVRNDYAKTVFNGEVGIVCHVGERDLVNRDGSVNSSKQEPYFKVDYSGHYANYGAKDVGDVEQCWAATVHKSQGCEFPVVVLVCPASHHFMLNRNLLYTGVTRAKTLCVVVGDEQTVENAAATADATRRHTGLGFHMAKITAALEPEPQALPMSIPAPGFIQIDEP